MLVIELLQVALGIRTGLSHVPAAEEWGEAFALSKRHAIAGVLFGGIEKLSPPQRPPIGVLLEWIGVAEYQQTLHQAQRTTVRALVELWNREGIHTIELKGASVGRHYPRPELRFSCDFDCFLIKEDNGEIHGAYEQGNRAVERIGVKVNREFYKNSSFIFRNSATDKGINVENHQFCCPVRGNRAMKRLEKALRKLLAESIHMPQPTQATYHPISQFNALFLMEHMWAHFFEEALTLKQVCDWLVFRQHCSAGVDWALFEHEAKACGFWQFAVAMNKIADTLLSGNGNTIDSISQRLDATELRLWHDILSVGGHIEMNHGWKTRFQLIENYFRNGWKYRSFAPHGPWFTLLRTSIAYIIDRKPKL